MQILTYPNSVLNKVCEPVTDIKEATEQALQMLSLLQKHGGIGLAAPQVGIQKRFFVTNVDGPRVWINPEIVHAEAPAIVEEACLSLPGEKHKADRYLQIAVVNNDSEPIEASGTLAIVIQHELDHLDGKLINESTIS